MWDKPDESRPKPSKKPPLSSKADGDQWAYATVVRTLVHSEPVVGKNNKVVGGINYPPNDEDKAANKVQLAGPFWAAKEIYVGEEYEEQTGGTPGNLWVAIWFNKAWGFVPRGYVAMFGDVDADEVPESEEESAGIDL